jgi:hypothetical protein
VELINLSTDYVHIRKEQNIAEWKKVDKCENASKELKKQLRSVMNMENLTMLIKLQDGTTLGVKEQEEREKMKMNNVRKKYMF